MTKTTRSDCVVTGQGPIVCQTRCKLHDEGSKRYADPSPYLTCIASAAPVGTTVVSVCPYHLLACKVGVEIISAHLHQVLA